jgi:hypothetical protein
MDTFTLGFLGLLCLGLAILNFFNRDWMWRYQVRLNEARGIVNSERTQAWENGHTITTGIGVVIGILFLGAALVGGLGPQPPVGQYTCASESIYASGKPLILQSGGQGTYDGQPLTWKSEGGPTKKVIFEGNMELVSGEFPIKGDQNRFVLTIPSGEKRLCSLR